MTQQRAAAPLAAPTVRPYLWRVGQPGTPDYRATPGALITAPDSPARPVFIPAEALLDVATGLADVLDGLKRGSR